MITRLQYGDTTWVDLNQPTEDEVHAVVTEFAVNPFISADLLSPSVKSRVERHDEHLYLILHFPVFKHSHSGEHKQEVDFVIGKNFLITTRYDTVDSIEKYQKLIEVNSILDHGEGRSSGALFFGIIREIYESLFNELEYIENWIGKIERNIFSGKEREMVFALSDVSRTVLNFKKATVFHREVLKNLHMYGGELFDDMFTYNVTQALHEYSKLEEHLRTIGDSVMELRETNNSLVSTRQNEIMKTLTIVASITFPITIIAAIFSMDDIHAPIIGNPHDFYILLGFMAISALCMILFFKRKKWL